VSENEAPTATETPAEDNATGWATRKWQDMAAKLDAEAVERGEAPTTDDDTAQSENDVAADAATPGTPEDDGSEPTETDEETPDAAGQSAELKELHALAEKLGLKVDARGVTKEERYGFRQEKRDWHEKAKKRDADYAARLEQTQRFYAPLGSAVQALQSGDYDTAIRELAKAIGDEDVAEQGMNGVTKRVLAKASGQDPEVDELKRWKRAKEREESERAQAEAQRAQQAAAEQEQREFTEATAAHLQASTDPVLSRGGADPYFAHQVASELAQHWDGYETITPEEAAGNVLARLRTARDNIDKILGDRDATLPETQSASDAAGRPGKKAVGQKPKPHNGRHATEASPRGRELTAEEWRHKGARLLEQATDD
jgi:hypothetical protein